MNAYSYVHIFLIFILIIEKSFDHKTFGLISECAFLLPSLVVYNHNSNTSKESLRQTNNLKRYENFFLSDT